MKKDERIYNPIRIKDIQGFYEKGMAEKIEARDLSAEAFILSDKEYEFVDFIFFDKFATNLNKEYRQYIMISDKYKLIFSKYNPDIVIKPIALINKGNQYLYWMCKIIHVMKACDESELDSKDLEDKYKDTRILRLDLPEISKFIIKLEVVESILRRNCIGVVFELI